MLLGCWVPTILSVHILTFHRKREQLAVRYHPRRSTLKPIHVPGSHAPGDSIRSCPMQFNIVASMLFLKTIQLTYPSKAIDPFGFPVGQEHTRSVCSRHAGWQSQPQISRHSSAGELPIVRTLHAKATKLHLYITTRTSPNVYPAAALRSMSLVNSILVVASTYSVIKTT